MNDNRRKGVKDDPQNEAEREFGLLDRGSMGGSYAREGFLFQDHWVAFNLLDWVTDGNFHGFVNEGVEDVDVHWSRGGKRDCDIYQLKNCTIDRPGLVEILDGFQRKYQKFPMSGYHVIGARCVERLNSLPLLLKRTRDYRYSHGQDSRLAVAAIEEFGDKLAALGIPSGKAPFIVDRVNFDFAAGWISNTAVFRKQFNLRLRMYGVSEEQAEQAEKTLVALVAEDNVGKLVQRQEIIALLDRFTLKPSATAKSITQLPTAPAEHRRTLIEATLDEPTLVTVFPDGAVMLRLPGGVHGLVDCGMAAASWIVPYLEEHKVDSFDFIAISHWDADRFRGVTSVVHALRHVGKFLVPSVAGGTKPLVRSVLAYLEISEAIGELQAMSDRTVIRELADSANRVVRVEAFAADQDDPANSTVPGRRYTPNDRCTVFRLSVDDRHFLITADTNVRRWTRLFERQLRPGESIRSDGLTLPHHGSRDSLNKEILHKLVDPTGFYAIVDPLPRFGLPHRRVLDLVREENGEIVVCDTAPVHMLLTRDGLFARRFPLGSMSQIARPIFPRLPDEGQNNDSLEL